MDDNNDIINNVDTNTQLDMMSMQNGFQVFYTHGGREGVSEEGREQWNEGVREA